MEKRIGWKVCPAQGGKYAVAELFGGDVVGNGIIILDTKEQAQEFIDSGKADEFDRARRK